MSELEDMLNRECNVGKQRALHTGLKLDREYLLYAVAICGA
jgi:hypothetical protein